MVFPENKIGAPFSVGKIGDPGTKAGEHPEDRQGAAQATEDNDLTTGHSEDGDGGDANSKQKKQ